MRTPHISVRVDKARLSDWQDICEAQGTDVSSQIRALMDAWVSLKKEQAMEREILTGFDDIDDLKAKWEWLDTA